MQTGTRLSLSVAVMAAALVSTATPTAAARIEAVKGKHYTLTRQHGPWMIMVASFSPLAATERNEGMTPEQAASELVWELRRKGIPAYVYGTKQVVDRIETPDRMAAFASAQGAGAHVRTQQRQYIAQHENICVLAGNYDDPQGDVSQKTLEWIKKFYPDFLKQEDPNSARNGSDVIRLANGGVWRKTPGQPTPLAGAFLTTNPLLTLEEAQQRRRDPLLLKLNADSEFSLRDNPGKYTLVVATFSGKSALSQGGERSLAEKLRLFDATGGSNLDEAGLNAWQLCKALRAQKPPIQAWVWHDRYQSLVTVGSFNSPDDPVIEKVQLTYGAKVITNEKTGFKPVLIAEPMVLPGSRPGEPIKTFLFDPKPRLMEVPHLR